MSGAAGMPQRLVAKKLKGSRDNSIFPYEEQMEIQCIAKYLAQMFNVALQAQGGKWPILEFLTAWSIQMVHRPTPMYANLECFVKGEFEKFNSNIGYVSGSHEVLQSFSHWTHHATNGYLMVVDVQVCLWILEFHRDVVMDILEVEFMVHETTMSAIIQWYTQVHCTLVYLPFILLCFPQNDCKLLQPINTIQLQRRGLILSFSIP